MKRANVVLDGDFADPSQRWQAGVTQIARPFLKGAAPKVLVTGSRLTIALTGAGSAAVIPNFGPTAPLNLVNVAVLATVEPGALGAGEGVGVVCRAISGHAYLFSLGTGDRPGNLSWSISSLGAPSRQLRSGTVTAPGKHDVALEGDCVGGRQRSPTRLVLSLDGRELGRVTDSRVSAPYLGLAGLHVSSAGAASSTTFASFQVRAVPAS